MKVIFLEDVDERTVDGVFIVPDHIEVEQLQAIIDEVKQGFEWGIDDIIVRLPKDCKLIAATKNNFVYY